MVNKGSCDKPDCPYNHDEKFIAATKKYYDEQAKIEESGTFEGEAESGRGAFVALRAAMPVLPVPSPVRRFSLKQAGSQIPTKGALKVSFDEWNLREEFRYPWREMSTVEFIIFNTLRRMPLPKRNTTPASRAAAIARTGQMYSWLPAESLGEGLLMEIPTDLDVNKLRWKECKPKALPVIQFQVERICDSGAATALASIASWLKQGLPRQLINESLTTSSEPSNFATGNGAVPASCAWTVSSDVAGEQQAYNLGGACPLVFAQGQVVLRYNKVYIWHPDLYEGKPFFCPVDQIQITMRDDATPDVAVRVHDYTPVFKEWVTLRPALVSEKSSPSGLAEDDLEPGEISNDECAEQSVPQAGLDAPGLRDAEARAVVISHCYPNVYDYSGIIDYEWTGMEWQEPCENLASAITKVLQSIPDDTWTSKTRSNVRPAGQDVCDQLTLGLVSCATYGRVPMLFQATWKLVNLTSLILVYFQRLGGFCEPVVCTSIQLSRNVQSRLHVDKNNQGESYITGLGSYEGGATFFYSCDEQAPAQYVMTEKIKKFGDVGTVLHGYNRDIKQEIVAFDGTKPHGTLPFTGERFAVIGFSVGTSMYDRTPALMQAACSQLVFRLPRKCGSSPTVKDHLLSARATKHSSWDPSEEDATQFFQDSPEYARQYVWPDQWREGDIFRGFECQIPTPPAGYHWQPTPPQGSYRLEQSTSSSCSSMRRDAPAFKPRAATVAAGEDPAAAATDETVNEAEPAGAADEALVLQHLPSQPEEETSQQQDEEDEPQMLTPEQDISEPDPSPSQEWAPSDNEGEGSPRIQPSEVPKEYLAELQDFKDQEPENEAEYEVVPEAEYEVVPEGPEVEHVLPKIQRKEEEKDKKKKVIFGAPGPKNIEEDISCSAEEKNAEEDAEALERLHKEADDERAHAAQSGKVSGGLDLMVSQEDISLYKNSTCSIHNLTHLPKDPHCPICCRAKMFYAPARKLSNQSEMKQHAQRRFEAREPFDLIFMDMKIVNKGSKGKIHEASLNLLDAWTGATRTYRLTKHRCMGASPRLPLRPFFCISQCMFKGAWSAG